MGDRTERTAGGKSHRAGRERVSGFPMTARFEPDMLWEHRAKAFRKETMPYYGYMAQSGFPGFLLLALIVGSIGYASLVRQLPDSFPNTAFGVALLIGFVCWSPLRTWLQPADTVFLLPRESSMGTYLRRSFIRNGIPGLIGVWAMLLIYWPVYSQGNGRVGAAALIAVLTALKAANIAGAWQERRTSERGARRLLRLLRWTIAALTLAALLQFEWWKALAFGLLAYSLLALVYRIPRKHRFPWDTLIAEETRTRRRYYRFFAMFIDVPTQAPRIARRAYAGWIGKRIPLRQDGTYTYLYVMTLIRTELGGLLLRMTLLGMLVVYWLGESAWLSGWGAAIVLVIFAGINGLQLGALRQSHKHAVWGHIYPLPAQRRIASLAAVDRTAYTVCTLLQWVPGGIMLAIQGMFVQALAVPAAVLLYGLARRPQVVRRKLAKETEED